MLSSKIFIKNTVAAFLILFAGMKAFAQYPSNTTKDSMILKIARYQKNKLNLSDSTFELYLTASKIRQQYVDSLNKTDYTIEERGVLLRSINQQFYQQIKTFLSPEQWNVFVSGLRERKTKLMQKKLMRQPPEEELPETDTSRHDPAAL